MQFSDEDQALVELLGALEASGYAFVTPTPDSHRRVIRRPRAGPPDLRDVFGWSRSFAARDLGPEITGLMARGGVLACHGPRLRSRVRVSTVRRALYLHSAFPASGPEAVFLGPDTYRFADFIARALDGRPAAGPILDVGAGAGVGGLLAASLSPGAALILTDVNPQAARLCRINAAHAGLEPRVVCADGLGSEEGPLGLVVANPPYVAGHGGRVYRDGGDMLGARMSLDWALAAAARLAPAGRLLLYTGSAIVDGEDRLRAAAEPALNLLGCDVHYQEIDPDVFGGLLNHPAYWKADRIAAIGLVATRRA